MSALSATLRCQNCGSRLSDGKVGDCPRCHANLAEVGVWSELFEWGKTRQKGRTRYIWINCMLETGGLTTFATILGLYLFGTKHWMAYAIPISLNLAGIYAFGCWHWRAAELQYQCAVDEELTNSQS
ncbi:MAG: hypothetical protein WD065_05270 [Planctomycetaceae bacterium]